MTKVWLYSLLLVVGIALATLVDLSGVRPVLSTLTMMSVCYIMIEVGLEFSLDKNNLRQYLKDYLIAATAAGFPWIFCAAYFFWVMGLTLPEALLVGRFAAPTSAGVLFAMLAAAGLGTTWLFRRARLLAIFDDLDTILFMVPLQILIVGMRFELFIAMPIILVMLYLAYRFLHQLRWKASPPRIVLYSILITLGFEFLYHSTNIEIEVILPAFAFGCILCRSPLEHEHIEPRHYRALDSAIKYSFMFLVGASLPPPRLEGHHWAILAVHVAILFLLSNLGKMFPSLCYRKEASGRERLALSIAMFPRGEVGASVLLVTASYGIASEAVSIAELTLALNLLFTGIFIWIVIALLGRKKHA